MTALDTSTQVRSEVTKKTGDALHRHAQSLLRFNLGRTAKHAAGV